MKGLVSCYIRLSAHAIHKLAKIPFSAWAEGVLADAVNGSCPTNPLPTSFWCTVGQPMHGKTTLFFFYKPHLFYIRHSQQPQKRHFLTRSKPTQTRNRVFNMQPHVFFCFFFIKRIFSPWWIFNSTFSTKIFDWPQPSFEQCFLSSERFIDPSECVCSGDSLKKISSHKTRFRFFAWHELVNISTVFLICFYTPSTFHSTVSNFLMRHALWPLRTDA